jgi:hypothetical protein
MVLTVSFGLSLVIGLVVTITSAMREHRHRLTPASRRQDHTTLPSAEALFVESAIHVHRIPHSTSVTIAKRPSCRGGTARVGKDDLPDGQSGKFFVRDLDKRQTESWLICPSGKSPSVGWWSEAIPVDQNFDGLREKLNHPARFQRHEAGLITDHRQRKRKMSKRRRPRSGPFQARKDRSPHDPVLVTL